MNDETIQVVANRALAAVVIVVFFAVFRKAISASIGSIKSIDVFGVKATSTGTQQIAEQKQATETTDASIAALPSEPRDPSVAALPAPMTPADQLLIELPRTPLHEELVADIRRSLQARDMPLDGPTVDVLIHYLADASIGREFELVYSIIFGSQIKLLRFLNDSRDTGLSPETISDFFTAVQLSVPDLKGVSQQAYMSYLSTRLLVRFDTDRYNITVRGIEFLQWMARMGRTENRAL